MNGGEVLRIVDAIHREKGIDKELIFESIEQALALAAKKHLNTKEHPVVKIDRAKGDISAFDGDQPIETSTLGRIAYQAARQLFVQKLREVESESVFSEFLISSSGFSLQRTMSTFSPLSSSTTLRIRLPRTPTQAPRQSTRSFVEWTVIFVR